MIRLISNTALEKLGIQVPSLKTKAYQEKSAQFLPKLTELEANAVVGKISVDEFFKEYEKLKEKGLNDILSEAKAAWEKMNTK
jgi:hypothetical protein